MIIATPTTPAERVLAAFAEVQGDARSVIAGELRRQPQPFLYSLGVALGHPGPKLPVLTVSRALHMAKWNGSAALLDTLGTEPPWGVVREALAEAIGGA